MRRKVFLYLFVLFACFCMNLSVVHAASGFDFSSDLESNSNSDLEADYDDPDYVKHSHQKPESVTYSGLGDMVSPYTGQFYTHADKFDNRRVIYGIDVSKWQGNIDWKKVKAAGVQFAFIRCGYTAVNDPFRMYADPYFEANIKNAHAAGLKVGVYYFSNAKSLKEVKSEVNKTLSLIEPYRDMISLPVVYDYEAFTDDYRAYGTSGKTVTENAVYFMDKIRSNGYEPMYYGCPEVLDRTFDVRKLDAKCWLANYTSETKYAKAYDFWQYSENGRVNGITTPVDCNFYYDTGEYGFSDDFVTYTDKVSGVRMSYHTKSSIKLRWNALASADGYKIYRSKAFDGVYKKIKTITDRNVTVYKDTGIVESDGREYFYKIVPYQKHNGTVVYGSSSDVIYGSTKKVYKTKVKAVVDLNIRERAGTGYSRVGVLNKNKSVLSLGYTYDKNGSKWYKIKHNGVTGYVSGSHVKLLRYGEIKKSVGVYKSPGRKCLRELGSGTDVLVIKKKSKSGDVWSYVRYKRSGKYQYGWVLDLKIRQV